jgi:hypothetical protein
VGSEVGAAVGACQRADQGLTSDQDACTGRKEAERTSVGLAVGVAVGDAVGLEVGDCKGMGRQRGSRLTQDSAPGLTSVGYRVG